MISDAKVTIIIESPKQQNKDFSKNFWNFPE